ncbi:VaFE repeat-containing surface-anchored protein [Anaerococcus sp.]|uniref:VaFE repeat-containing surface-anchored protein n=1 Tax=Anaerococcus sp. TaxID=1872515 RepID=UPI00280A8A2D|nr:VaFE repeat-containing surface-anchored protein [Anaerococcus sp.]MDU3176677.1 VaFE repeat-containing surface-anchored protein [Anaerococcus sp.]
MNTKNKLMKYFIVPGALGLMLVARPMVGFASEEAEFDPMALEFEENKQTESESEIIDTDLKYDVDVQENSTNKSDYWVEKVEIQEKEITNKESRRYLDDLTWVGFGRETYMWISYLNDQTPEFTKKSENGNTLKTAWNVTHQETGESHIIVTDENGYWKNKILSEDIKFNEYFYNIKHFEDYLLEENINDKLKETTKILQYTDFNQNSRLKFSKYDENNYYRTVELKRTYDSKNKNNNDYLYGLLEEQGLDKKDIEELLENEAIYLEKSPGTSSYFKEENNNDREQNLESHDSYLKINHYWFEKLFENKEKEPTKKIYISQYYPFTPGIYEFKEIRTEENLNHNLTSFEILIDEYGKAYKKLKNNIYIPFNKSVENDEFEEKFEERITKVTFGRGFDRILGLPSADKEINYKSDDAITNFFGDNSIYLITNPDKTISINSAVVSLDNRYEIYYPEPGKEVIPQNRSFEFSYILEENDNYYKILNNNLIDYNGKTIISNIYKNKEDITLYSFDGTLFMAERIFDEFGGWDGSRTPIKESNYKILYNYDENIALILDSKNNLKRLDVNFESNLKDFFINKNELYKPVIKDNPKFFEDLNEDSMAIKDLYLYLYSMNNILLGELKEIDEEYLEKLDNIIKEIIDYSKNPDINNIITNELIHFNTEAYDPSDNDKEVWISESTKINDKVNWDRFNIGSSYRLEGSIINKRTGQSIYDFNQETGVIESVNNTDNPLDISVELDLTNEELFKDGDELVFVYNIYETVDGVETLVAVHNDLNNKDQTFVLKSKPTTPPDKPNNPPEEPPVPGEPDEPNETPPSPPEETPEEPPKPTEKVEIKETPVIPKKIVKHNNPKMGVESSTGLVATLLTGISGLFVSRKKKK